MLLGSYIIDEWEGVSGKGSNSDFKSIDSQFCHRALSKTQPDVFLYLFDLPDLDLDFAWFN